MASAPKPPSTSFLSDADLAPLGLRKRVEMPIFVDSTTADGHLFHDEAKTVEIAARGGVIAVTREFKVGQPVLVVNPKNWERIACDVLLFEPNSSGINHIAVAFKSRSLWFWGVGFSEQAENAAERKSEAKSLEDSIQLNRSKGAQQVSANRRNFVWYGLGLLALLGLLTFYASTRSHGAAGESTGEHTGGSGTIARSALKDVPPEDARLIPDLGDYRLATPKDFDPDATRWLQLFGLETSGIIPGTYSGTNQSNAYILVGKDNTRRIVIVADGQVRCDGAYRSVALAARVPKDALQKISWADSSDIAGEGDGLLVVGAANNPASGTVLLLSGDQVVSRVPADFHLVYSH